MGSFIAAAVSHKSRKCCIQLSTDDEAVAAADDNPEVRKINDEIVQAIQKRMDEMECDLWADEPHQLE
jgi:hypothetical protein